MASRVSRPPARRALARPPFLRHLRLLLTPAGRVPLGSRAAAGLLPPGGRKWDGGEKRRTAPRPPPASLRRCSRSPRPPSASRRHGSRSPCPSPASPFRYGSSRRSPPRSPSRRSQSSVAEMKQLAAKMNSTVPLPSASMAAMSVWISSPAAGRRPSERSSAASSRSSRSCSPRSRAHPPGSHLPERHNSLSAGEAVVPPLLHRTTRGDAERSRHRGHAPRLLPTYSSPRRGAGPCSTLLPLLATPHGLRLSARAGLVPASPLEEDVQSRRCRAARRVAAEAAKVAPAAEGAGEEAGAGSLRRCSSASTGRLADAARAVQQAFAGAKSPVSIDPHHSLWNVIHISI